MNRLIDQSLANQCGANQCRTNQRGVSTIFLLGLLPFFLALGFGFAAFSLAFKSYVQAQHRCRVHVLRAQHRMAGSLNKLLELNPRARTLRTERTAADRSVTAAASFPPALAAAKAWQASVIALQLQLAAQQRTLLSTARMDGAQELSELNLESGRIGVQLGGVPPTRLKVLARPMSDLSPDYEVVPVFEKAQEIRLTWKIPQRTYFKIAFKTIPPNASKDFGVLSGACAATMKRLNGKWIGALSEGKSWWSF
jgi:hypothetical protein